jgi:Zn-dependent oligopeptidase
MFNFKDVTVEQLEEYKKIVIEDITGTIEQIIRCNDEKRFQTVIQPLIDIFTNVEPLVNIHVYAKNFYPQKEIRETGNKISNEISKFMVDCLMNKDLYNIIQEYYQTNYLEEKERLDPEEIKYIEKLMRDFKRDGLHLDDQDYENIKSMKLEIVSLCSEFGKNINDVDTSFVFSKMELDGVPDYWFTDDKIVEGGYKVTLKYPDYIPIMEYAKNEEIRKKLFIAFHSRCKDTNVNILNRIIQLRYNIVKLLGYQTHADFRTEISVVKTAENAKNFLENMNELFTPIYKKDETNLTHFAKHFGENPLKKDNLDNWDTGYYKRLYIEKECNFNMEKLREYFLFQNVVDGIMSIYQNLLGLKFEKVETDNKWDSEVTYYKVSDASTLEILGHFFMDLYPREGKFSHAAVFNFMSGANMKKISGDQRRECIVAMVCNFPKDGCISFNEVKTFFHEFGHVMHQICGKQKLMEFNSFNVETDFLEVPSQFFENWVYTHKCLHLLNQDIPNNLIDKLVLSKKCLSSTHYKRQLLFGLFDLEIHNMKLEDSDATIDLQKVWYDLEEKVFGSRSNIELYQFASFGHLTSGYDAAYYGYLRAETIAVNLFYKMFTPETVLDSARGIKYRKEVLEIGSTLDGLDIVNKYLGEEPNDKYFIEDKC